MPSRLEPARPRTSSRPPQPRRQHPAPTHHHPITLEQLGEEEEWEPVQEDQEILNLPQLRERIGQWEEELRGRGRAISGRTIVVVHSLPYVATLHPLNGEQTTPDVAELSRTPLEILPGDPLLRPRALHSPTSSREYNESDPFDTIPKPDFANGVTAKLETLVAIGEEATARAGLAPAVAVPGIAAPSSRWILRPRRGHAALNSGLKSLSDRPLTVVGRPDNLFKADGKQIGMDDLAEPEKSDLTTGLAKMSAGKAKGGISCVPVWLDDKIHTDFYEGMCKTYLWPVFHYFALPDEIDKKSEEKAWNAYYEANLVYAKKVAETYESGDLIWIHDYHLLLVPGMLRKLLPNEKLYISLFLHCPFPSSEYFRCLPRREQILDGMLGCNLVVFQTHSYARHFLSSCVRVMGYEAGFGGVDANGSITRIAHCPIGIDTDNVETDRAAPGVGPKMEALKRLYAGRKVIIGRDKLDPTKGVLPKLRAFERFLRDYPEWKDKVVLIQVTSPAPGDSAQLASKVSELVDHINATYGSLHFQPVHHYHQTIDRDEYFALLTVADLALVTSIRDGMNTTSMEYVMCQAEAHGPLILSEFTGVSASLKAAIRVNPWDLGDVAKAIDTCLNMTPQEKELRHTELHQCVSSQTSAVWAATNILKLLESLQGEQATQDTPALKVDDIVAKYKQAKRRLILLDYDGTLTPIVKIPSAAVPSQELLDAMAKLTGDPNNIVYVISGRDGEFLHKHLGQFERLGMSAEHGSFIRGPGEEDWKSLTDDMDMGWKRDVLQIFRYYEARTMGSFVEKKLASVTFHYRNSDPLFGAFQAKECQAMLEAMQESLPIDVLVGKKNVEVRPAHTSKGDIVERLLYLYPETEFVLCAGDDKTDEDMFHSLSKVLTSCAGGEKPIINVPESLLLFPSLADSLAGLVEKGADGEFEARQSNLDPEAVYMVAIDGNSNRMTLANYVLESPKQMISTLVRLVS